MNDYYSSRGPVSTLPGFKRAPEEGMMCDDHPERAAVVKRQGETDSFGCEYFYQCQECSDKTDNEGNSRQGHCDRCSSQEVEVLPTRDLDEGSYGRVYWLCASCRKKQQEYYAREYY